MSIKTIIIIAAVLIILAIVWKHRLKIRDIMGLTPKSNIQSSTLDIATVNLSENQGAINALMEEQAEIQSQGNTSSDEYVKVQKQIQILKLSQKTNTQFTQGQLTQLFALSLVELQNLNTMTTSDLMQILGLEGDLSTLGSQL